MTAELAIKQLVNDNKIPTIAPAASDELVVPVSAYVWQTAPLSSQIVNTCLAFLNQQGKTSVAMLFDTRSAFAVSGHASTLAALNTYSLRLVDDEAFELGQTNFTPQFAKIVNARPDVLFVWGTGAPAVVITRQWSDQCTGIPLMMTAAEASPLYVPPAGAAAEGVFVQATLGVIGRSLSTPNKYKKLIDDFAGPFQQQHNYYPPQFAWDGDGGPMHPRAPPGRRTKRLDRETAAS